ncbi:MAG: MgtC/SapB family protein [Leptospiraceae bacterium]|nr:MgtC/SapB family protein [Leptospiraceae bacterium]
MDLLHPELIDIQIRLGIAALCGIVVGLERGYRAKPAGVRTHMLISIGAALFMIISVKVAEQSYQNGYLNADPARIAAQIVTGIGFLGAGAIIRNKGLVLGMTSAATIWCMAAIGMAVGAGLHTIGVYCTVGIVLILELLALLEDKIRLRRFRYMILDVIIKKEARVQEVRKTLRDMDVVLSQESIDTIMGETHYHATVYFRGDREDTLVKRVNMIKGVQDVILLSHSVAPD